MRAPAFPVAVLVLALCGRTASPVRAAQADDSGLGAAPFGHMHMLYERTIFQVDVLTLDVCVDAATARIIERRAADGLDGDDADSIMVAAIDADAALGRIRFRRGVSLDQFLGGIRDEQEKAVDAGLLDRATYAMIGDSLPVWFDFLEDRGIHEDDRITYVFRGDSLRTVYADPQGAVLLDRTDVGRQRRTSVVATWFAPGSAFRRPLLRSLDESPPAAGECAVPGRAAPDTGRATTGS